MCSFEINVCALKTASRFKERCILWARDESAFCQHFKTETKFSLNQKVGDECGEKGNLSRSKYRARISKNPIMLALFKF